MTALLRCILVCFALALAACGFHLREQANVPDALRTVYLEIADPGSRLHRDLPGALERAGAKVLEAPAPEAATLRIPVSSLGPEPLSVGSTARVREYTMRYRVEFDAVDAAGAVVIQRQQIELSRDYTFDETQALGVAAQEEELRRQLERDMVQAILRRIEAAGRH
ncbi:LPS assembly lipoprotein LptE [Tahibacter amnicola]|uniref:LPS-assembly lipoprotein LptE n=1 Tax=Tahibacter amnicola TaxID=2976241 RepID=A0ABY6BIT3_9GAMM|nr:LPS assembly lipoprotein LptE [Tahibacter amnicola]UXI69918.1 LPS assembly lipoprotein LptE [Tahibacter amnicola]